MVRLDSIKLKVETPLYFDRSRFTRIVRQLPETDEKRVSYEAVKTGVFGFGRIRVLPDWGDREARETVFTVSAKSLGLDYPRLITADTVEQLADNISSTGHVAFSADDVLNATVLTADVTTDLHPSNDLEEYFQAMDSLSGNPGYVLTDYKGSRVFRSRAKVGDRMTLYSKQQDLLKGGPGNKEFLEAHPSLYNAFDGIMRVETNCKSARQVRRALGFRNYQTGGQQPLQVVLEHDGNPNHRAYMRICQTGVVQRAMDELDNWDGSLSQYFKFKGLGAFLEDLGFDMRLARQAIRRNYKGQPSNWYRDLREAQVYLQKQGQVEQYQRTQDRLEEIGQLLLAA